jgi:hypothetical protein
VTCVDQDGRSCLCYPERFPVPHQFTHVRRPLGTALAAALTLAALSGCSSLLPKPQKTLPPAQLKSELLTAPTGSKPFARGTLAPGGILDLDQFVDGVFTSSDRVTEQGSIAQQGFKYAVETNWEAPDGSQADVFLVQFADSSGAQDYVSSTAEGTADQETPNEPLASVPGVPGGESWTAGAVDSVGNMREIGWFTVGNVAVDLHTFTPGKSDAAAFDRLAQAQYARLVKSTTTPSPLPAPTGPAPAPTGTAASATPADRARLQRDLVAPPGGSQPWTAKTGPTGVLTLQQFASAVGGATYQQQETAEDTDRGFQFAVRENWFAANSTQADIYLVQFSSATGAQSFVLSHQGGAGNAVGSAGTYAIPGSGDATAYEHSGLDSFGNIWTESYAAVGDIGVSIDFWVPAKADRAEVTALFQQQYARLMADPTVAQADHQAPPLPTPGS